LSPRCSLGGRLAAHPAIHLFHAADHLRQRQIGERCAPLLGQLPPQDGIAQQGEQRITQRLGIFRRHAQAVFTVTDQVDHTAHGGGHHRHAGLKGLQHDIRAPFPARRHHRDIHPAQQTDRVRLRRGAGEPHMAGQWPQLRTRPQRGGHRTVAIDNNAHVRQMNNHLLHRVQQEIRPFLPRQPSQEPDPQRSRVADDDRSGFTRRHTVGDKRHPFARIAQRQRGGLFLAGHRDDRRRPAAGQPFDPAVERAPARPALHHQERKSVRSVDHRHAAEGPRRPRQRTGFGAVRVDQVRTDTPHAAHQPRERGEIGERRHAAPHRQFRDLQAARAPGRQIGLKVGVAPTRHRQDAAEGRRIQRPDQITQVAARAALCRLQNLQNRFHVLSRA